jgi:NAD(P)-dependent dehydrogenase (short-subunit alcohol dehydrogenase family)
MAVSAKDVKIPAVKDLLDFDGRTVIVTGASGGIGAGIVRRFAEAGANVVIHYRSDKAGAARLAAEIGKRAAIQGGDLTKDAAVKKLMDAAIKRFKRIDAVVNNAAKQSHAKFIDMPSAEFDEMMRVNLGACFRVAQAAAQHMKSSGGGAIVNVSSISGLEPAFNSHYCVSKAGLNMMTQSAALELGPMGVRINTVAPGAIWREGIEKAWPDGVKRFLAHVPLGRLGRAEDVADACLYLCSPAARWVTGALITVDGGVTTYPSY